MVLGWLFVYFLRLISDGCERRASFRTQPGHNVDKLSTCLGIQVGCVVGREVDGYRIVTVYDERSDCGQYLPQRVYRQRHC